MLGIDLAYLGECNDTGFLSEVELARAEEVEHGVEVPRLPVEFILVQIWVVSVAEFPHLLLRAAGSQLAQPSLRKPFKKVPSCLQNGIKKPDDDQICNIRTYE